METVSVPINQAAASLGVSRSTIYRLIREDQLAAVRVRNRTLIPTASIRALVSQAA